MLESDIQTIIKEKEKANNKNNFSINKYKVKSSKKPKTERKKSKSINMRKTMIHEKSRGKKRIKIWKINLFKILKK